MPQNLGDLDIRNANSKAIINLDEQVQLAIHAVGAGFGQ